jgi:hypothetical protein
MASEAAKRKNGKGEMKKIIERRQAGRMEEKVGGCDDMV